MKKLLLFTIFVASSLHALPLVNPADSVMYTDGLCWHQEMRTGYPASDYHYWAENLSVRFGFSGDYVFNRCVEERHTVLENATGGTGTGGGDFMNTTLMTNAGTFCVNFADWIEAYAGFGVTTFTFRCSSALIGFTSPYTVLEFVFSPTASYLVGAAAPIWQEGNFLLGVQAQYFYAFPDLNLGYGIGSTIGSPVNYNQDRAKYVEYQGAIMMSYSLERENLSIVPFAGIQFSGLSWNLSNIVSAFYVSDLVYTLPDAHEQQVVGWTLGTSMYLSNRSGVTAEVRLANEKALHIGGQVVF